MHDTRPTEMEARHSTSPSQLRRRENARPKRRGDIAYNCPYISSHPIPSIRVKNMPSKVDGFEMAFFLYLDPYILLVCGSARIKEKTNTCFKKIGLH